MKVYLDIDDTLLNTDIYNTRPAEHLKEFLAHILKKHDVYWLTTHCNGDATVPVQYLSRFLPDDVIPLIMRIKPTRWSTIKTEAIDMSENFVWLDDVLSWGDEKNLKDNNKLNSYIRVNLDENPNILNELIGEL